MMKKICVPLSDQDFFGGVFISSYWIKSRPLMETNKQTNKQTKAREWLRRPLEVSGLSDLVNSLTFPPKDANIRTETRLFKTASMILSVI